MSDQIPVSARVTVNDQATGPVDKISRAFANMARTARGVGQTVSTQLNRGAFGGITANVHKLSGAFGTLAGMARGAAAPIIALSGLAGAVSIGEIIGGLGTQAKELVTLGKLADQLRTNATRLDVLHYAATRAGLSIEQFDEAMKRADMNMAKAGAGKNKDLAALFKRLGMSSALGKPAVDMLEQFADAVARQKNTGTQLRMLTAVFGKQGRDMLQFFSGGSARIKDFIARAMELSPATEQNVKDARAWAAAVRVTKEELGDLAEDIGKMLIPAITPLLKVISEIVKANKEQITDAITDGVERLSAALQKVDWQAVIDGIKEWYEWGTKIFNAMGGWTTALIAFGLVLAGPLLAAIASLTAGFITLTAAIITNPIGAAIALVIAAVAGAAFLIYHYWDDIRDFFRNLWPNIKQSFDTARQWLTRFASEWVPKGLQSAWRVVGPWFRDMWQTVRGIFNPMLAWLNKWTGGFVPASIEEAWAGLSRFFETMWNTVKLVWNAPGRMLDEFVAKFVPQAIIDAWQGLAAFFETLWGNIRTAFETAWGYIRPIVEAIVNGIEKAKQFMPQVQQLPMTPGSGNMYLQPGAPSLATPPGSGVAPVPGQRLGLAPSPTGDLIPRAVASGAGPAAPVRGAVSMDINVKTDRNTSATVTSVESEGAMAKPSVNVGRTMEAPA